MRYFSNRIPLLAIIFCAALGAGYANFSELSLAPTTFQDLSTRFLSVIFLALVVERGVEIYMTMVATSTEKTQRTKIANRAALWLSFAIALCGVRVIAQLLDTDQLITMISNRHQLTLLRTVDISVTTLLLAGGADGMHQILNRVLKPAKDTQTSI